MIRVSPSILAADFANLEREIGTIKQAGAEYVHIDVMDGLFVPNISIGLPVLSCIRKVTDLTLDVHLMIDRPVRYAERFCQAGADIVTVHVEADTQENTLEALRIIRACGKKPAICVKPKTPAEAVLPFIELVDLILVMTVEPGFGGQSFMADMMPKVRAIRVYIDEKNPGLRARGRRRRQRADCEGLHGGRRKRPCRRQRVFQGRRQGRVCTGGKISTPA